MLKVKVLIEGILLCVIGAISIIEGIRLVIYKNPVITYDPVGPSFYVLITGLSLMIVGILYIIANYRKSPSNEKIAIEKEMRIRLIGSVVACVLYVILIDFFGYLIATWIFLFIEFRIVGVNVWLEDFILSTVFTAFLYFVFVVYCSMIFPKGIIFE
jgi:putative tricarboxylic transport membrane protein